MSPRIKHRCKECGTITGPEAFIRTRTTATRTLTDRYCDVKCYRTWYKEKNKRYVRSHPA